MANTTEKAPPPKPVYPEPKEFPIPDGCFDYIDKPLKVRYVVGMDLLALVANIITAVSIFGLVSFVIGRKTSNPMATVAIPLALVWVLVVIFRNRLWTRVDARKAHVFLNNLSRNIIVYPQGFHFTSWFSTKEPDEVDFQKHEIISAERKNGEEIRFPSKDGYGMFAEINILFKRRDGQEGLSRSLKFPLSDIKTWLKAVVVKQFSDVGGHNSYETLLYYKAEIAAWAAKIFGGDDKVSPFEIELGISVKDPVVKNLDLDDESRRIFSTKAKVGVIADGIREFRGLDVNPDEAAIMAQVAQGAATRVIHTYQGVPQGARVVALGDAGIAISDRGGKK